MTDPRERRRQRAAAQKDSVDVGATLKKYRVPIVIVILWGAIIGFQVAQAQGTFGEIGEECPGHWHAGFSVWVDGQQLRFNPGLDGSWADSGASPAAGFHLHGEDGIMHIHPAAQRCVELGDIMEKLDVQVHDGRMIVNEPHPQAGTYEDNGTTEVVVYHKAWEGSWKKVDNIDRFMGRQIGNGDQVMIAYMDSSNAAQLETQQTRTTDLSGSNYEPQAEGNDKLFVGITMTTIFALLALMLWYNFAKKTW